MNAHLRLITGESVDEDELSPEQARELAAFLRRIAGLGLAGIYRMAAQLDRIAEG